MAYSAVLNVANTSYPNIAADGSYYASAQLDVHLLTDLFIAFSAVSTGVYAPFLIVYGVDLVGNLIEIGRLTGSNLTLAAAQASSVLVLGAGSGRSFGKLVQVKAFAGLSTPPLQFALSIEGKGVA